MRTKTNMDKARKEKNDEFYTMYEEVESEVMRYREQFENKVVLCNCDDPVESNFWQFFHRNFSFFKLKKLISTHYVEEGSSYAMIYDGCRDNIEPLTRDERIDNNEQMDLFQICSMNCNGDFRSPECIKYLEEADIVCTNPPFSLFEEYVSQLMEYNKKFLVIGNMNATIYLNKYIKENKIWLGYNTRCRHPYIVNKDNKAYNEELTKKMREKYPCYSNNFFGAGPITTWYTNMDNNRVNEEIILYKEYNKIDYPKYENYDAINVNKTTEIPCDYFGYMGVPTTFIEKYNPNQFRILGYTYSTDKNPDIEAVRTSETDRHCPVLNGKALYGRIIICRKYDNEGRLVKDYYDKDGNLIK